MENDQNKPENSQGPLPISEEAGSNDVQPINTANEAEAVVVESASSEPAKIDVATDSEPKPNDTITEEKASVSEPAEEVFSSRSSMITAIIVLVVIIGAFWYISRGNNQNGNGNGEENVKITVNSNEEAGEVKIINEEEGGKIIPSGDASPKNEAGTEKKQPAEGNVIIKAFYSNTKEDPSLEDCNRVYALEREVEKKYDSDVVNTVRGLLIPLSDEEKAQGWISNIPAGSALSYVKIDGGVAIANFNSSLGQTGGSCAVTNIRAQIEQTLKQFPYIKTVTICVNGNCNQEEILQP